MTDDVQFECHICHKESAGDAEAGMTACRLCGKLHCPDCVDEFGRCVACAKPDPAAAPK